MSKQMPYLFTFFIVSTYSFSAQFIKASQSQEIRITKYKAFACVKTNTIPEHIPNLFSTEQLAQAFAGYEWEKIIDTTYPFPICFIFEPLVKNKASDPATFNYTLYPNFLSHSIKPSGKKKKSSFSKKFLKSIIFRLKDGDNPKKIYSTNFYILQQNKLSQEINIFTLNEKGSLENIQGKEIDNTLTEQLVSKETKIKNALTIANVCIEQKKFTKAITYLWWIKNQYEKQYKDYHTQAYAMLGSLLLNNAQNHTILNFIKNINSTRNDLEQLPSDYHYYFGSVKLSTNFKLIQDVNVEEYLNLNRTNKKNKIKKLQDIIEGPDINLKALALGEYAQLIQEDEPSRALALLNKALNNKPLDSSVIRGLQEQKLDILYSLIEKQTYLPHDHKEALNLCKELTAAYQLSAETYREKLIAIKRIEDKITKIEEARMLKLNSKDQSGKPLLPNT